MATRILRFVLILLTGFLALTAFAGGVGLLADLNAPPVEMLEGSPFSNYIVPGLALFFLVGGFALAATILLVRRHGYAALASALAGVVIVIFEIVEVMVIGSPAGIARDLQIFYSTLGLLILAFSIVGWLVRLIPQRAAS
jgi:hypothetical protein